MLDGWHRSVGVTAEIKFARGLGLPIEFREFVVKAAPNGRIDPIHPNRRGHALHWPEARDAERNLCRSQSCW